MNSKEHKPGRICPPKCAYLFDNFLRPLVHRPGKIFGPWVKPGMHVADIGCGFGFSSLAMANMVGEEGRVVALDLQPEMLEKLKDRAEKAGLAGRIRLKLCDRDSLNLDEDVDFAVAFYMVHEVPDPKSLMRQVRQRLRENGAFLVVEPKIHVGKKEMRETVETAQDAGFHPVAYPWVPFSRAVALR